MESKDKAEFKNIITALGTMTGTKIDKMLLRLYWGALEDLAYDEFENAAMKAVKNCKFMPKPAEILEFAGKGHSATQDNAKDKASAAWVAVAGAVRSKGRHVSPDFEDPFANAAVRAMGGWISLCGRSQEDFDVWARKDFLGEYQAAARATNPRCDHLVGLDKGDPMRITVGTAAQRQLTQ